MKKAIRITLLIVLVGSLSGIAWADEVTEWNQFMLDALRTGGVGGVVATRHAAIVQSAVYDAVNGIERRYTPIHVEPNAAPGASKRAAAVQAAYAALVQLFPAQASDLTAKRNTSLAAIAGSEAVENSQSIARGIQWGQTVANAILAWRAADGFTSPHSLNTTGGTGVGQWRPTLPANAPFVAVQLGFTTPWVIQSPLQFPIPGPPPLTSVQYAVDFNEVKTMGRTDSLPSPRTADQTLLARFWQSASSPNWFWDRLAVTLGSARNLTLSENARLLALVNVAVADAGITVWRWKYEYGFWRPITAIREADTDNNGLTEKDAAWLPLL